MELGVGKSFGDLNLKSLEEDDFNDSYFHNKVVQINFSEYWCVPCRKSMPKLVEIESEFKTHDFAVVVILTDIGDPLKIKKWLSDSAVNFPILVGNEETKIKHGVSAVPMYFLR